MYSTVGDTVGGTVGDTVGGTESKQKLDSGKAWE